MEEPLKSSLSIKILRCESTKLLSALLNSPKVIPTPEGLSRNWKGLAELCMIESYLISNLEFNSDPTKEVLRIWSGKGEESTIKLLVKHLETLDRFDVIEDIISSLAEDIEFHNQNPNGFKIQTPLYNDHDKCVLTVDDVANIEKNELIKYDAFVLFADDDIDFATEVIEKMEKQYNLKFCAKDRDLVGGTFEHNAIMKLISERCEKLIVILSPSFFKSPLNKFFLTFAQAISLEHRKIIPCLYKQCPDLPAEVRCYFMLDYTKPRVFYDFWQRLYDSIKTSNSPQEKTKKIATPAVNEQPRQLILKKESYNEPRLRVPPQKVKFSSLVDLTKSDMDHIMPDASLNPSTSANSLGTSTFSEPEKKIKSKTSWFRKLLQNYKNYEKCNQHIKSNGDVDNNREKKGFWNRHRKRKVEIAT